MQSLEAMRQLLADYPLTLPVVESVRLHQAAGRVAAQAVAAAHELPAFDNSAMDGYALATRPEQPLGPFTVIGCSAAGSANLLQLAPGEAARVLTGAPLPLGCQGVVPQEKVNRDGDQLRLASPLCYGAHMRLRGSELAAGTTLLRAGERIRSLQIGLLATQGLAEIEVRRRPVVGVLSTGSELEALGLPLSAGKIYDANRPQLLTLIAACGGEPVDLGWVSDDLELTVERLRAAARYCDVVVSSGGASVGDADHIRGAVERLGAIRHWQVAIKPGKPFAFGYVQGRPFLGLPGNPVAAAVTFLLLAGPFIRRAGGEDLRPSEPTLLPVAESLENPDKRCHFLRARRLDQDGVPGVQAYEQQGSAALVTLAEADLLIELPPQSRVAAGDLVRCHSLFELTHR